MATLWNVLVKPSESPDLNPSEHVFHLLKTRLKAKRPQNKQEMNMAVAQAWQSITREHAKCVVMSRNFRLSLSAKDLEPDI